MLSWWGCWQPYIWAGRRKQWGGKGTGPPGSTFVFLYSEQWSVSDETEKKKWAQLDKFTVKVVWGGKGGVGQGSHYTLFFSRYKRLWKIPRDRFHEWVRTERVEILTGTVTVSQGFSQVQNRPRSSVIPRSPCFWLLKLTTQPIKVHTLTGKNVGRYTSGRDVDWFLWLSYIIRHAFTEAHRCLFYWSLVNQAPFWKKKWDSLCRRGIRGPSFFLGFILQEWSVFFRDYWFRVIWYHVSCNKNLGPVQNLNSVGGHRPGEGILLSSCFRICLVGFYNF